LRLIAQGLDVETSGSVHSQALSDGMRALEEAEDLIPRGSRLEADIDVAVIVSAHRTPVLRGAAPADLVPAIAVDRYYAYAEEQLAVAAGGEPAASLALQSLGKLHGILATNNTPVVFAAEPKAMVFHQAALLADPHNFLAANDLAVLVARAGDYPRARELLSHGLSVAPQAAMWHNLSVVQSRLGETELAEQSRRNGLAMSGGTNPANTQAMIARQSIRWVDPATFAAAAAPSSDLRAAAPQQPPAPAASNPDAIKRMARWLRRSDRQQ
jgi:tetratricopeptide repeat protein